VFVVLDSDAFIAHEDNISKVNIHTKIASKVFTYIHPFIFNLKLPPAILMITGILGLVKKVMNTGINCHRKQKTIVTEINIILTKYTLSSLF